MISDGSATRPYLGLAHALHEILPRQPILLATASASDVSIGALADAGIVEILRRPLVSCDLATALARCLRPRAASHDQAPTLTLGLRGTRTSEPQATLRLDTSLVQAPAPALVV